MSKVYKGDVGTVILIDCSEDISTATAQKILVKKPDKTETEWTATVYQDDYLRHVIASGELDQAGIWYLQPYVELVDWQGYGETVPLRVYDEFK